MIQKILLLSLFTVACCQYPHQRAPPMRQGPPPEEYEPPPQRRAPPPQAFQPRPQPIVYRPADVHYVNIGTELAGDYKFGYDTGKGNEGQSFREETRLPDGTVQGAYGYIDETGKQRIVKYTAGKDGFKAEGDVGPGGVPKAAPARQAAPVPVQASPAPQPSYRAPPPQPAYQPPPQTYAPPPQSAYQPPPQQPAYRSPPAQPANRPPPTQASYAHEPQAYAPRPRPRPSPQRHYAPEPEDRSYNASPDYDDPNNDITERRLVPVDTSLFNYDIGANKN